jgi:hypothetical protein
MHNAYKKPTSSMPYVTNTYTLFKPTSSMLYAVCNPVPHASAASKGLPVCMCVYVYVCMCVYIHTTRTPTTPIKPSHLTPHTLYPTPYSSSCACCALGASSAKGRRTDRCVSYIGVVSVYMQYDCVYYCDTWVEQGKDRCVS